jgi:hypothetical protein
MEPSAALKMPRLFMRALATYSNAKPLFFLLEFMVLVVIVVKVELVNRFTERTSE